MFNKKSGALATILLMTTININAAVPTATEMRQQIMLPSPLDTQQFADYDRNADGKIDVADLVHLLTQDGVVDLTFKTGTYVGIFQPNTLIAKDSKGDNEAIPIEIILDSLSPPAGHLDNSEDNFSFYFPSGENKLNNLSVNGLEISFDISVSSSVPMISDQPITRTFIFSGDLVAADQTLVIAGRYTEKISGFTDVSSNSLDVERSGNFVLFQEIGE